MSDIDTAVVVDGLKALDPKWPIREADIIVGPLLSLHVGLIELILTLIAAAATALLLLFAHDALGMPIDMIRVDALGAAGLNTCG